MAHFLISYLSSDKHWAYWIDAQLKALRHRTTFFEWHKDDIDTVGPRRRESLRAWTKQQDVANYILGVVSNSYLNLFEYDSQLWRSERPSLFVVAEPCELARLSVSLHHCELFGMSDDAARARFRKFIKDAGDADVAFSTLSPEEELKALMRRRLELQPLINGDVTEERARETEAWLHEMPAASLRRWSVEETDRRGSRGRPTSMLAAPAAIRP